MLFTPHRSTNGAASFYDSDSDIDSLWSQDSEEEEFPIKPKEGENYNEDFIEVELEEDEDDVSTPPSSDDGGFRSEDESFREFTKQRLKLLKEVEVASSGDHYMSPNRGTITGLDVSPATGITPRKTLHPVNMVTSPLRKQTPTPSSTTPGSITRKIHLRPDEDDSFSSFTTSDIFISSPSSKRNSRILNQVKVTTDINKLDAMVQKWNDCNLEKYSNVVKDDEQSIEDKLNKLSLRHDFEVSSVEMQISEVVSRRKKRVSDLINEKLRIEAEILKEKKRLEELEKERIRQEQEEIARKQRELEENKRREEEEEKRRIELAASAKRAEEARIAEKAAADEAAKKIAEEKAAVEKAAKEADDSKQREYTDWKQVEKEFIKYKSKITEIKEKILAPVSADSGLRKYCFQNKRHIKVRFGQLTNSKQQLQIVLRELSTIFEQAKSFNELAFLWLLNFFAKGIVAQAETETTVAVQSSVPLGILATFCMAQYPQLVDLLLARFVKKCPQVIGYSCSIDTEEGRTRMGYKRRNEKWEDETAYSERISGMCSVWTVITMTEQLKDTPFEHPYPFSNSWKFIARQLNKDPKLLENADYGAVAAWWDLAADRFVRVYGRQAIKLLQVIANEWTQLKRQHRYPSALRLQLLGEEWYKTGRLTPVVKPMVP